MDCNVYGQGIILGHEIQVLFVNKREGLWVEVDIVIFLSLRPAIDRSS